MIFVEGLLRHWWTGLSNTNSSLYPSVEFQPVKPWRRNLVHIACHQLEPRIAKGFAALIIEGYPADELQHVGFRRRNHVITCLPVHAAGHIAELCRGSARLVGQQFPRERGLEHRIVSQRREQWLTWQGELQLAVDFNDGLLAALGYRSLLSGILWAVRLERGVMGHIAAADDFALYSPRSAILVGLEEINGLALIEGKEQLL
ncbi:MAG: hypothetical protein DMG46_24660 [Acidobacteria bacterium]|nr:MAG: hypothetical protein DMG46_24660 [Acidobacteriota bacterium]